MLTVAFLAMCTVSGALVIALSSETPQPAAIQVALAAACLAAVTLWLVGRSDLDAVLTLTSFFLLAAAICIGIYLLSVKGSGLPPKIAFAGAAVTAAALGALTIRRQRGPESPDFPNLLASRFAKAHIFETAGVQFTAVLKPGANRQPHRVFVVLQNSFDAPRTVSIRLDAANAAKYLRFQPEHRVQLGAAEVSSVSFPVVAPTYPATYSLFLAVGVSGSGGRRVRRWRAREVTGRMTPAKQGALLAAGIIAWGGGIKLTVGPLPDDLWGMYLDPPIQESIWRPREGTVAFAQ